MRRKNRLAAALAAVVAFTSVPVGDMTVSADTQISVNADETETEKETETKAFADISVFVKSQDETMGTVTASVDRIEPGTANPVTLTAIPASDMYKFVKWVITDGAGESGSIVSENENAQIEVTLDGDFYYTAIFAKKQEVNISLNKTSAVMTVGGDTLELTAEVKGADNTNVTWKVVNTDGKEDESVAMVKNGMVTAVAAGEATIIATAEADTTKSATCSITVKPQTVNKKVLMNTLLEAAEILNQGQNSTDVRFSEATQAAAEQALAKATAVYRSKSATQQEVTEAEQNLRDAVDHLQEVYKVDIDISQANGATVTVDAPEGEYRDESQAGHVIVYLPLIGKISVTAPATDGTGQYFESWQIDGKVVSTRNTYTFYVIEPINLEVTYKEENKEPYPEVNLFCSNKYNKSIGKLSFIGKRSVASVYKVVEHGIVITDETGWKKYQNNQNAFVKGASRTKKSVAAGKANNGTYEARLKCGKTEKWYGRSYVTYTDGTHTYTEYSKVSAYPAAN